MNQMQKQVAEFMRAAGQEVAIKPKTISRRTRATRVDLIQEELNEYKEASLHTDIYAIADAIGDMLYTVFGAACQHGINIQPIWDEIYRSNMTKFIDGHLDEASGKWIKGPSYSPANLKPIIDAQIK